MLSIRLSRVGKKKQPSYRLIVTEKRRDPWGKHLEILGFYNPRFKNGGVELKNERIKYWLERGAQPSPTVHNLLVDAQIIQTEKVKATSPKKKKTEIKEKEAAEKTAAETPAEEKATGAQVSEKEQSEPAKETKENNADAEKTNEEKAANASPDKLKVLEKTANGGDSDK